MEPSIIPELLNSFLIVYFFEIENELNNTINGLENIKFQSEEANTDEHLKKHLQKFLSNHNRIKDSSLKQLCIKIDSEQHIIEIKDLLDYNITNVLIPEQLTSTQKKQISESKHSVYTNPDLYLVISDGTNLYYQSVELKSTKDNNIPGSSVQQVSPFEWVIFVKREIGKVSVTTGFYINSLTDKLPFPDRSPRPQIGFKTLSDWNKKYRKIEKGILTVETISKVFDEKVKLLTDWQDYLATEWIDIINLKDTRSGEKWFNNTIRKFSLKFLEYINTLNEKEKEDLMNKLKKNIH